MKVYFVIPAFNEAENIPALLHNLQQTTQRLNLDYQVILVDDGSSDGTASVARAYGGQAVSVLEHAHNQGPGAAFRNGFRAALKLCTEDDLIVSLEADNTSDLSILPAMLSLSQQRYEVVLASVYSPGGGIIGTSWQRKVLSWGANQLLAGVLGTRHIHTYSSFFRVYRPTLLMSALHAYGDRLICEPGFVCMVELLMKLHLLGARFAEVPMILDGNLRLGTSKMKIWRTISGYGRVIWYYCRGDYQSSTVSVELPTIPTTLRN
ncbi:MAG: glycosyltransferase family 2 protein [Gemmatimonadaceae bacterium]|nr:glycosyltransferase family 2 protein [Gloeobacterales cyanobacterium ES-bin-141]